jgi:hypothetical protein
MNGGTACTVPPVADTIQDICPVNCESSYTNKCDRSTAGVNKRTYTVTKIAANRKCNAADGEELKNQIGSETKNRDECAINCESTFTDHCDHSTGGIRKRHYNVTGIAYNRKCIASDGKQLTNSTGLQITDNERCPVDCKYSYTEVGCENGIKKYKVDRGFGPKMNGGRDCYYKGTLIDTPEQVFKATTLDESEMCITNCSAEKLSEKCDRSTGGKYLANYRVNSLAYNTNCNAPDGIRLPNAVGVHNNIDTGRTCPVNGTAEMQRVPGCATGKVQYKSTNYQAPLNGGGYPKYNNRDIVNNDMVFNSGETCNTCEGYWDNWSACKNIDNRCQRERNYTIPGPNAGSCPENIRNQKQYSTSGCVGSYLSKTECRWNPRGGPFGVGLHECNTHEDLNTCVG